MTSDIRDVLKKLHLKDEGRYDNHFYIITLSDSDEYARMYSQLSDLAVNTEYPSIGKNTTNTTVKITNYFEIEVAGIEYLIFLIADFSDDSYILKIGEK